MAAITWKTVLGNDGRAAAPFMDAASEGMNQGFSILDRVLQREQAAAQARQDRAIDTAKQGYLDMLQGAQSVDALEQMRASGQLDSAYAALDPRVRDQVRGAADARLAALRDQLVKGQQFEQEQARFAALPLKDKIGVLSGRGDYDGANALIEQLPEGQRAAALASVNEARLAFKKQGQDDQLFKADLEGKLASTASSKASTERTIQGTDHDAQQHAWRVADRVEVENLKKGEEYLGALAQIHQNQVNDPSYGKTDTQAFQEAMVNARRAGIPDATLARLEGTFGDRFDRLRSQRPVGQEAREVAAQAAADEAAAQIWRENSPAAKGATLSVTNVPELATYINSISNNDTEKEDFRQMLGKYVNGIRIGGKMRQIPLAVLQSAMAATKDTNLIWFNNRAANAESLLVKMMSDPVIIEEMEKRRTLDGEMVTKALNRALQGQTETPKKK